MEHAEQSHPEVWKAYLEAFEEAKRCTKEAVEAGTALQSLRTIEGHALLRQKQLAARSAVDDWRQTAEDLYVAMGIESQKS